MSTTLSITLQILMVGVHAGLLYFLYKIYRELTRMRKLLKLAAVHRIITHLPSSARSPSIEKRAALILAIWIWRHGCWELDEKSVPPGCVADKQPSFPGSFEGQRVKTEVTGVSLHTHSF